MLQRPRGRLADKALDLSVANLGSAGAQSVRDAMRDHLSWFADRKKSLDTTEVAANARISPALVDAKIAAVIRTNFLLASGQ